MVTMGVGKKTAEAALWFYGLRILTRLIGLARTAILARLLSPTDFGLVAIGTLAIGLFEVLSRSGLSHSLIQATNVESDEFHAVWTFEALRGVLIAATVFLSAPLLSSFFGNPNSLGIIRVLSIVPILNFSKSIYIVKAVRAISFRKIVFIEGLGSIASVVVGICWALLSPSVWALVAATISGVLVQAASSYIIFANKPKFVWDFSVVRKHFRYGYQIWLSAIATHFYNHADDWLVGRFFNASSLGYYQRAYSLGNLPTTELVSVLARVLFPSFSSLKTDKDRLWKAYLRVQKSVVVIVAPITFIGFFFAEPLISTILSDKWLPIKVSLQILVLWGSLRCMRKVIESLFRAIGNPKLTAISTFVKLLAMVALFWPARFYGIEGVASIVMLTSVIEFFVLTYITSSRFDRSFKELFHIIVPPYLISFMAGGLLFFVGSTSQAWLTVLIGVVGMFSIYAIVLWVLDSITHRAYLSEFVAIWHLLVSKARK